jgi:hypothetical protein
MSEERRESTRAAILKTVAFFDTMDYPPTRTEAVTWGEYGSEHPSITELEETLGALVASGMIEEGSGRLAPRGRLTPLLAIVRERTPLFPRKIRTARKVARWLARNPAVRFVAVANTTALAHARDGGDLDFFVIVRQGSIWSSRLLGGTPYRLTGRSSGPNEGRDAVCLSYFVSDKALDLLRHMLPDGDDPYFRYWFLALLPLYDDGVSRELWGSNAAITSRHPRAEQWMISPDLEIHRPVVRIPGLSFVERFAKTFQMRWFPSSIRERMNKGTDVIVSDDVLKFHVDDGRAAYRTAYQERLRNLNL